jgi:N-acyl-L-homoserine lactone synthetase
MRTSITVLLSEIQIASIREIAQAVGMSTSEFVRVFQELPLDDNSISKRLSVSRQQVISYRLSARRRLDRRMKSIGSLERDIATDRTRAGDSLR